MSTTGLVMTVTDELLAELEDAASNATQDAWELLPGTNLSGPEVIANGEPIAWVLNSEADAVHIALANPATIAALTTELRRLRAENAALEQSLAESRANDQAAMGWLTSLRWASGDRGERMLPELVEHIEGLAKDAGRYRWLRDSIWYVGPDDFYCGEGGDMNEYENHNCQAETLDAAIDAAMAAQ